MSTHATRLLSTLPFFRQNSAQWVSKVSFIIIVKSHTPEITNIFEKGLSLSLSSSWNQRTHADEDFNYEGEKKKKRFKKKKKKSLNYTVQSEKITKGISGKEEFYDKSAN